MAGYLPKVWFFSIMQVVIADKELTMQMALNDKVISLSV